MSFSDLVFFQHSTETSRNSHDRRNMKFIVRAIFFIYIFNCNTFVNSKTISKRGVMDSFNDGLKYAGQMFGINTAADVANLVAKAFSTTATRNSPDFTSIFHDRFEENESPEKYEEQEADQSTKDGQKITNTAETIPQEMNTARLITSILKLIGFDAGKLGALAINALIMIAQAIGGTLMTNSNRKRVINVLDGGRLFPQNYSASAPQDSDVEKGKLPRKLHSDNPIDWFLENPNEEIRSVVREITDASLADRISDIITNLEKKSGQEGECIKMLMCKSSPFIWGMQKSLAQRLRNESVSQGVENKSEEFLTTKGFFAHLPSLTEYREHGKECEKRFSIQCNTTLY